MDVKKQIQAIKKRNNIDENADLKLNLNIDGGSRFKHSKQPSFWPVFGSIHFDNFDYWSSVKHENIILVGVSRNLPKNEGGQSKPSDDFMTGIKQALLAANIKVEYIISDYVAKAYILSHQNHKSTKGCVYCHIVTKWVKGRSLYPDLYFHENNYRLKSEEDYRLMEDSCFISLRLFPDVPICMHVVDPLHFAGHGLIRRNIQLIVNPSVLKLDNRHKISATSVFEINNRINNVRTPHQETFSVKDIDIKSLCSIIIIIIFITKVC